MIVSLIAAVDSSFGIGLNNQMPWPQLDEDLRFFRSMTLNSTVIMGRLTFESIGSKALQNRNNIVITRNQSLLNESKVIEIPDTSLVFTNSLEQALSDSILNKNHEAFIIGGAKVYQEAIAYADRLYLTHIPNDYFCDRFFPQVDEKVFSKNKIKSFISNAMPVQIFRYDRVRTYSFV